MKVIIIDDDVIVSSSLKRIVEVNDDIEVVAVGNDGDQVVDLYEEYKPDIVLMGIRMRNILGTDAARDLLFKYPDAKIIFLTTFSDTEYIKDAVKIGAKGYILKQNYENIAYALYSVMNGHIVYGEEISKYLSNQSNTSFTSKNKDLNKNEIELLTLVSEGFNNKEIAKKLNYSEGTVRNYLSELLYKLELRDRTQLAIYYYKNFQ